MTTLTETSTLEKNLRAIARSSPAAARLIAETPPREDAAFFTADDGALAGEVDGVGLCSKRRPIQEAERLVSQVDVTKVATIAISGFALGHHVAQAARKLKGQGLVVVFEPDVPLLRAVLERVDITPWWCPPAGSTAGGGGSPCLLVTDADDRAALSQGLQGRERDLALGLTLLEHPPSRARLGESGKTFHAAVDAVMQAFRPAIMSALVKSAEMFRNATQNLEYFARGNGVRELQDIAKGRLGVVVAAGPSLQRNIDALAEAVRAHGRERLAIIAVQTALKTLLAKGIKPHFVVAVDYAEISRRFYEGLTRDEVEGITLVVEPTVNPAVTDAWAELGGMVRTTDDAMLDLLLGEEVVRAIPPGGMGHLERAATVAHLAYYLARHLGCEPVALIGQDLGFTDGQYYAGGAAIHDVWGSELNPFLTLETLEWQRIARMGARLMLETDVLGRPVYTDRQMHSYLVQFERDFAKDAARGLTTIDATEGGVRKANTTPMPLRGVIETYVTGAQGAAASPIGVPISAAREHDAAKSAAAVRERVQLVRQAAWRVHELSDLAAVCLSEMLEHQADQRRVNGLITKLEGLKRQVAAAEPAFTLTQFLNQAGVLSRVRKDRDIVLAGDLTPIERQRLEIERDLLNVRGTGDAAEELEHILDEALAALDGAPKRTRPPAPPAPPEVAAGAPDNEPADVRVTRQSLATCAAVVALFDRPTAHPGAHGPTPIPEITVAGTTALELTLRRLARSRECERLVVLTDDIERARRAAGSAAGLFDARGGVEFVRAAHAFDPIRHRRTLAARAWARRSWRGGLGGATVFDEVFDAELLGAALTQTGLNAALVVSTAWCMVDPALCDELVRRCRENPEKHGFTFSQAPPGLGACVLTRGMVDRLAEQSRVAQQHGTARPSLGSLVGYWPTSPSMDLIAFPMCAPVEPSVRDAGLRLSACSMNDARVLGSLIASLGGVDKAVEADAKTIVSAWGRLAANIRAAQPEIVTIELTAARDEFVDGGTPSMSESHAAALLEAIAKFSPGAAVSFEGSPSLRGTLVHRGDPLAHDALPRLIARARSLGLVTHVRSELVCGDPTLRRVVDARPEVVSVDMFAEMQETAAGLAGRDLWRRCRENIATLLGATDKTESPSEPGPSHVAGGGWVVPRLTRRDAVYEEVEPWYTRWLMLAGWAVIDPLPAPIDGERITPLPVPTSTRRRDAETVLFVRADGSAHAGAWGGAATRAGNVFSTPIEHIWSALHA